MIGLLAIIVTVALGFMAIASIDDDPPRWGT
jgi:hypothetical protein